MKMVFPINIFPSKINKKTKLQTENIHKKDKKLVKPPLSLHLEKKTKKRKIYTEKRKKKNEIYPNHIKKMFGRRKKIISKSRNLNYIVSSKITFNYNFTNNSFFYLLTH